MDRKSAHLLLNLLPEIGPLRIHRLLLNFGSPEEIFKASNKDICQIGDIGEELAKKILSAPKEIDLEKELKLIEKHNVKLIFWGDAQYPPGLKNLPDAPPVLYLRGEIKEEDVFSVAIVGTRRASNYGKMVTERIAGALAEAKITIVSGLARGIDTVAHQATLVAGGRTIAVLGNGLALHYPPENRKLEEKIINSGALVTEFPMTYPPDRGNFPRRNRLIAGLSFGVLVVEADIPSGALITARLALEQGREVFAVPGSIFSPTSRGTHLLIKEGAKLVEETRDIIDEIQPLKERWLSQQSFSLPEGGIVPGILETLTLEEKKIYNSLPFEPVSIDSLLEETNLPLGKISHILISLEMKKLIKALAGKMYQRFQPNV